MAKNPDSLKTQRDTNKAIETVWGTMGAGRHPVYQVSPEGTESGAYGEKI
jgi:hypothetical protein